MKTLLKPHCVPCLTPLALALSLAVAGCGKKEVETPTPTAPEPAAPSAAALRPAERTSFDEVTSHLDAGGRLYGYLATEQWLAGLSTKVEGWREPILNLPGIEPGQRKDYAHAFDVLTQLIGKLGVEEITGVGVSGIALEPGLYQTKVFVHHNPGDSTGYLWSVAGTQPRLLSELDWLPPDTVWAAFGSTDLAMVWDIIKRELAQAGTAANAGLAQMDQQIKTATGNDLATLLATLGGEQGILLTLDPARTVQIPVPGDSPVPVPDPALLMAVKVKDDTLFELIDHSLQSNPQVIRSDENGLRCLSLQWPVPLPVTFLPTVARYRDYLFVASNDRIVRAVVSVDKGEMPGLKSSPEFQRLAKGMPAEGNNFTFVSERLGRTVKEMQQRFFTAVEESSSAEGAPLELLRKLRASGPAVSSYAIGSIAEDGWLRVIHGNREPASVVLAPQAIASAAIVGAIALPAVARAKAKAQSIRCVNNLKQVGLAVRLWAMDHGDEFPFNVPAEKGGTFEYCQRAADGFDANAFRHFRAPSNELHTPKVLVCPADKSKKPAPDWESLNASNVTYLLRSGTQVGEMNPGEVLARCPIHGHTLYCDGHVDVSR